MKYIFSLLLICSSYLSFSQMTVSDLIKIHSMNLDQLETYCLGKGFTFYQWLNNENYKGHWYVKGKGENKKNLLFHTEFYDMGKYVAYYTSNSNEYLNIKNQMKTFGFVLYSEETFDGTISKKYRNSKYQINLDNVRNKDESIEYAIDLFRY
jgi:hypothetical protein